MPGSVASGHGGTAAEIGDSGVQVQIEARIEDRLLIPAKLQLGEPLDRLIEIIDLVFVERTQVQVVADIFPPRDKALLLLLLLGHSLEIFIQKVLVRLVRILDIQGAKPGEFMAMSQGTPITAGLGRSEAAGGTIDPIIVNRKITAGPIVANAADRQLPGLPASRLPAVLGNRPPAQAALRHVGGLESNPRILHHPPQARNRLERKLVQEEVQVPLRGAEESKLGGAAEIDGSQGEVILPTGIPARERQREDLPAKHLEPGSAEDYLVMALVLRNHSGCGIYRLDVGAVRGQRDMRLGVVAVAQPDLFA